jgi:ankyrin repeat protein
MTLLRRNSFLRACAMGALPMVRRMLDAGENIHQTDPDGNTAVSIAIANRNLPLLRLLAERRVDLRRSVRKPGGNRFYPVELAIMSGFTEGLRFMVDGLGVPLRSRQMRYPELMLFHALDQPHNILTLRYLVEEKKLDPRRAVFKDNYNLLHKAEDEEVDPAIVEYLLRKGVSPDIECRTLAKDRKNDDPALPYDGYPLAMAAYTGKPDRVAPYLRHGGDPMIRNAHGKNALDAIQEGWNPEADEYRDEFDETKHLLEAAAFNQVIPTKEENPFVLACAMGDLEEVHRRLEADEDPDQMNGDGMAGVHVAMETHDLALLKLLADYRADLRLHIGREETNLTPAELGIEEGFYQGLDFLDSRGVKLEARPGRPADELLFHALVRNDNILTLRWLVEEKGLDPRKAVARDGLDLLSESEYANRYLTYTEYLMLAGMDPNEEAPVRERHAADDDDRFDTKRSEPYKSLPLVRSAFNAEAALVQLYLDYNADPLKWNRNNNSAWDAATDKQNPNLRKHRRDFEEVRKLLIRSAQKLCDAAAPRALPPPPGPS